MTSGPNHYQSAEDFLVAAREAETGSKTETYCLRAAHVHAMLAVAAATIDTAPDPLHDVGRLDVWKVRLQR